MIPLQKRLPPIYVLQCAIPAFDGLFPDQYNTSIRIILFRLAEWHALAKLRLHTEDSLDLLKQSLRMLSKQIRQFVEVTCVAFQTKELPGKASARQRQQQTQAEGRGVNASRSGPRPKSFNILTYKFHALGDYVQTIQLFGTTDSYTTQIVSGRYLNGDCLTSHSGGALTPFDQEILWTYK